MNQITAIVMYTLWTAAIIFVLITTFTNFEYTDLNFIAMVLLVFAIVNSFFVVAGNARDKERKEKEGK